MMRGFVLPSLPRGLPREGPSGHFPSKLVVLGRFGPGSGVRGAIYFYSLTKLCLKGSYSVT